MTSSTHFIVCGPPGYAGAGRLMTNALEGLANLGHASTFVGPSAPFAWQDRGPSGTGYCWSSQAIESGAIGAGRAIPSNDSLFVFELAEQLVRAVQEVCRSRLILWAHYLVPYAGAALLARGVLEAKGRAPALWLTPAGSDVWEVGPQLKEVTRRLLSDGAVTGSVTYSEAFRAEIESRFAPGRPVTAVTPGVQSHFKRVSSSERVAIRQRLGISPAAFVISSHSNMRPVKAPEDIVDVARRVAAAAPAADVVLLLAGPRVVIERCESRLEIRQLGVVRDVAPLLQAADVELNLSRHDSFNLSIAEAMRCGIPVITTAVAGVAQHVEDAGAGQVVALESGTTGTARYESVVATLVSWLCAENRLGDLGDRAASYAEVAFDLQAAGKRYARLMLGNACVPDRCAEPTRA